MSKLKTNKLFNQSSTVETLSLNANGSAQFAGTLYGTEPVSYTHLRAHET